MQPILAESCGGRYCGENGDEGGDEDEGEGEGEGEGEDGNENEVEVLRLLHAFSTATPSPHAHHVIPKPAMSAERTESEFA